MSSSGSPVVLAVYDLSQGMARQMSMQLLNMQIDMIPHTGVVVFGKEYFFGGGIQALPHADFVASHMPPVQMLQMGTTQVSQAVFEEFLQNIRPRFTVQTYDLIRNNCNNFSDAVCQFLVGKSVPAEITGLPERVFSSPMGQMLRPMVEQMQGQLGASGSSPIPGFGGASAAAPSVPHNPWATATTAAPAPAPAAPAPAPLAANPWAHISTSAPTPASVTSPLPAAAAATTPPAPAPSSAPAAAAASSTGESALDAHTKPLLSADARAVPTLVRQLRTIAAAGAAANSPSAPDSPTTTSPGTAALVAAASSTAVQPAAAAVDGSMVAAGSPTAPGSPTASSPTRDLATDGAALLAPGDMDTLSRVGEALATNGQVPVKTFAVLHRVLSVWPTKPLSVSSSKTDFLALCLLRLLVIQPSAWSYMQNNGESRNECLDFALRALGSVNPGEESSAVAVNAGVMRLAVAANLFALPSGRAFVLDSPARTQLVADAALRDLHQPLDVAALASVRQMASAVLHNLTIHLPPPAPLQPLPEAATQIMIGCVEGLASEPDDLVLRRRAIAFGYIVRTYGSSVKELIGVLGLGEEVAAAVGAAFTGRAKCAVSPDTKQLLRAVNRLL